MIGEINKNGKSMRLHKFGITGASCEARALLTVGGSVAVSWGMSGNTSEWRESTKRSQTYKSKSVSALDNHED